MLASISQLESDFRCRVNLDTLRCLVRYLTENERIESRNDRSNVANARRHTSISDVLLQENELDRMQLHDIQQRTTSNNQDIRDVKIRTYQR
jgi:predicted transcriptional regulator